MSDPIKFAILGIVILLLVKYVILGLNAWDFVFHLERIEPQNSIFLKPLLGILG